MIDVWSDSGHTGSLDRAERYGSTFAYLPNVPDARAISLTMPVRLRSWDMRAGLAPIFEMNLPEGALREMLRLAFAKAAGTFDELDLLAVVGRSQIGRLRFTGSGESLENEVPFQAIDEILAHRRADGLYQYLLERFAAYSGISGVQPKILVRDTAAFKLSNVARKRLSQSFAAATHIVKFWHQPEYPQLAANEYFCLRAARVVGLEVPPFFLSNDGAALIVERFDVREDGSYRGVEDFCVLNGRRAHEKYRGSYESAIVKRFFEFAQSPQFDDDLERLFALIVLNCTLRNGDAHLKNFAVVYDGVDGAVRLAPAYDIVTTTVYLPQDTMALTLDGKPVWPNGAKLRRLGTERLGLAPARVEDVFARIRIAATAVQMEMVAYAKDHAAFDDVARRMRAAWDDGLRDLQ